MIAAPVPPTNHLEATKLKKTFNEHWAKIKLEIISNNQISLKPSGFKYLIPSNSPVALASSFLKGSDAFQGGSATGQDSDKNAALLLFCSASLIADHNLQDTAALVDAISQGPFAAYIAQECLDLLLISAVLRVQGEDEIQTLSNIAETALKAPQEIVKSSLSLFERLSSSWKPLCRLDILDCIRWEASMRWMTTSQTASSFFFQLCYLPWLRYRKRHEEFKQLSNQLLSSRPQARGPLRAFIYLQNQRHNNDLRTKREHADWLEWIRPGLSSSARIPTHLQNSYISETASRELCLNIPKRHCGDQDITMARYIAALQEFRQNNSSIDTHGISFISSIFKGAEWIQDFLDNMTSLDDFEQCELILINADSPEQASEIPIIRRFQCDFPNIVHIRLDSDPGLYNIWNLGVLVSRKEYLSNANLDDRKSQDFITSHLKGFQTATRPVSLVSAPCVVCDEKNADFKEFIEMRSRKDILCYYSSSEYYGYADFFLDFVRADNTKRIVWRNIPHCMPVWSRNLHKKYGYFNEARGGPTADLEFWLRCARQGETYRNLNTPKGLYYYSNTTTYSARKEHSMERIAEHHVNNTETANLSYLPKGASAAK